MSLNVKIDGSLTHEYYKTNILLDPEYVRKQQIDKNRKLRLTQVREKSRQIASNIRKNVASEKERQLRQIEHIKLCELQKWREKALRENRQLFNVCISNVGQAHEAAEKDVQEKLIPARLNPVEKCVKENRRRDAVKKITKITPKKPSKRVTLDRTKCSLTRKKKSSGTQTHIYPNVNIITTEPVTSTSEHDVHKNESSHKVMPKLTKTPPVVFEVNLDDDSTVSTVEDLHVTSNMLFSKKSFRDNRAENDDSKLDDCASPQKRFKGPYNEISEFIKNMNTSIPFKEHTSTSVPDSVLSTGTELQIENEENGFATKNKEQLSEKGSGTTTASKHTAPSSLKPQTKRRESSKTEHSEAFSGSQNRVQLYDYPNKFHKSYVPPSTAVSKEISDSVDARRAAELEILLEGERQQAAKELKNKSDLRSKLALEKEQAKKEYESLTGKLEILSKDKEVSQGIYRPDNDFVENRLDQFLSDRQKKMNSAVENVLKRPVLITCPEVRETAYPKHVAERHASSDTDILDVGAQQSFESETCANFLNSSDSCTSILLNYVDSHKSNCNNESKKNHLSALLGKINNIKSEILGQMKVDTNGDKCQKQKSDSDLKQEKLIEREKALKEKEKMLEAKLNELTLMQNQVSKKIPKRTLRDVDNDCIEPQIITVDQEVNASKPVQIVINLKDDMVKDKVLSVMQPPRPKKKTSETKKMVRPKMPTPKTPSQTARIPSENTSSTLYKSPPQTIRTKFGKLLETAQREASNSSKPLTGDTRKDPSNVVLRSYIQRLLGMTSESIEMLGVSSTEIQTPSSSIINVSANMSIDRMSGKFEAEKMNRLKQFIDDNYNFLHDLDVSLKSDKSIEKTVSKSDNVWKEKLRKPDLKDANKQQAASLKPILRKNKIDNKNKAVQKDDRTSTTEAEKVNLVHKYTQLADNCSHRIAELNEMISKVRQEKQKILEITLSSNSDTGRNSTEYMDFAAERHTNRVSQNVSKISPVLNQDPDYVQLEKNKLTGVSRDSGISMSRPVTALDTHESPEKSPARDKSKEFFSKNISTISNFNFTTTHLTNVTTDDIQNKHKKPRPPVSLSRFSPQTVVDPPHELSTIAEIETPGTSRINTSLVEQEKEAKQNDKSINNVAPYKEFITFEEYAQRHNLDLSKLDSDSSQKLLLDLKELISGSNEHSQLDYEKFPSPSSYMKDDVDSIHETLKSLAESLDKIQLNYRKFPNSKQYADEVGITSLLDSKTIDESSDVSSKIFDASESLKKSCMEQKRTASTESIPNVIEELKKRNLLAHPFEVDPNAKFDFSNMSDSKSEKKVEDEIRDDLDLEKDLNKMGLTWAALMLKKSQQSQALSSSSTLSSTLSKEAEDFLKENFKMISADVSADSSSVNSSGKPLNLKAFLARELQKRTNVTSSSTDESIASHFLRSLLNSSSSATPKLSSNKTNHDRLRTSTPVVTLSSSSQTAKSGTEHSIDMFSGESRLSSVKYNSQNSKSNNDEAIK